MDKIRFLGRIRRELESAYSLPGIHYCCKDGKMDEIYATISGPEGTPYEGGTFELKMKLSEKYPMVPPAVQFITSIYHPNIDAMGRICLDILKQPPQGSWSPVITISGLLMAIQILMSEPNPHDPLEYDIGEQYLYHRADFMRTAENWTRHFAMGHSSDAQSKREESEDQDLTT